uniref:Putative secreted protein n=1 Tax=Anopheles marajoara TaxID=58244 RepID=A0A2M4C732_9DIPT
MTIHIMILFFVQYCTNINTMFADQCNLLSLVTQQTKLFIDIARRSSREYKWSPRSSASLHNVCSDSDASFASHIVMCCRTRGRFFAHSGSVTIEPVLVRSLQNATLQTPAPEDLAILELLRNCSSPRRTEEV